MAAVYGCLEAIRIIANELEDKNPPAKKLSYYTPLHFATVQNHIECMEYILELPGIDANTKAYLGRTPLHIGNVQFYEKSRETLFIFKLQMPEQFSQNSKIPIS